jgi:choline-sulfatase
MQNITLSRREALLGAAAAPVFGQRKSPPNLLLIQADDLAAWMLGCYGNREIQTPNLDALARGGVRMNCFVCTPICSPSRATLLTGRTPMQHGIHDFLTERPIDHPPQGQFAAPAGFQNEVMLSDILSNQGYRCGYVGKWHMGGDQNPQHGFQFWYTLAGGPRTYENPRVSHNGQLQSAKGYLPELLTEQSLRFLNEQTPDRPFFLVTSHLNPHTPYEGHPQKYYDLYAKTSFDTVGWEPAASNALREKEYLKDMVGNIRRAAASITALDDQLPPLIKKLEQKGLRENTIILFVGDNGYLLGRHGLWSKGLASDPINMYEEVVQVPMIWNWPGKTPVQASRPELVSFYDVVPTVCDALDVPVPERNLCGRSFLPLLQGRAFPPKQAWRNLVFGHFRNTNMARDNRYKVVLRNGGKGPNELFDLRADVHEKQNQYDNPQFVSVRDRLTRDLETWRKQYSN